MTNLILIFLLSPICVLCQTIQESGPGLVKPSQQLKLTCTVSGFELTSYGVSWIRQVPGKGLEWIGAVWNNGGIYYADSLKSRTTISRDTSKKQVYLQINNMEAADTGMYYCARYGVYGSSYHYFDIWGNGQSVIVSSAQQQAPSLFPLYSCGTSQDSIVTIGCLARDFLPETINFGWTDKSNNSFTNGLKTYQPVLQKSGTFLASSQIKVTTESWGNHDPYYCKATHSLNNKVVKLINKIVTKVIPPVVTMHAPVKDDLHTNDNGTIVCHISGFLPAEIKVKWLQNHVETTVNTMTDKVELDASGKYEVSSYITVSKRKWDEDTVYSCLVEHSASNFFEIRNVSKSQACETPAAPGIIQVAVVPPSFETIYFNKKAQLTCIISNMVIPDGLEVSWFELQPEKKLDTTLDNPVYQDSSYFVKATAEVCADDWLKKTFECRVRHPDLTSPKKETLAKDNGQEPQMPTVLLFPPHQDELNKKESLTLTCLVKGFYPKDAFVKWVNGDNIQDRYVVTTEPMEESYSSSRKSYSMISTLTLPSTEDWNSGKSFTCMVGHESIPLQAIQKSIDKTTGKPTSVNVSLVMSDSC